MSAESFRQGMGLLSPESRGILALDDMTNEESLSFLKEIGEYFGMAKENANAQSEGWNIAVMRNETLGFSLMADAKYHDTPRTMKAHVHSTTLDKARFITVHTLADVEALKASVEGRDKARSTLMEDLGSDYDPLVGTLLGITVLTSHSEARCQALFGASIKEKVLQLAGFAVEAELEGIVCAGSDLPYLQKDPDIAKLVKVVPGIVLPGQEKLSGQARTMSPSEAISEGADFLVAGSAVTKARVRLEAAQQFVEDIARGLGN
jgi:orotidine-5'-phosphate decarboxylase